MIPCWPTHINASIYNNSPAHLVMLCHNRCSVFDGLMNLPFHQHSQQRIHASGIGHLSFIMFSHLNFPLLSVFVECWQPVTNTFHLPFEEMTIMLHDVRQIIRVPIEGGIMNDALPSSNLYVQLEELLSVLERSYLRKHTYLEERWR